MKKKLNSILLVDDDKDCNFFHQRLFNTMDCAEKVFIVNDGQEAIDFLKSTENGKHPNPDIIFLDINMPRLNGWEFMELYEKLSDKEKAKVVLIMLTTSLNPNDIVRAEKHKGINGYRNKYLDKETVDKIMNEYFLDYV